MDVALYDERAGFFTSGRGEAGRRGDFLTSSEVGPLFGAVLANALDTWWEALGQPDPYMVLEVGAGRGALALSVRAAAPRCAPALHYVLVERSAALRERQSEHLALTLPAHALGAAAGPDPDDGSLPSTGPLFTSLAELPSVQCTGVVLCNELLDNLPFDLLERGDDSWDEVRVGADDHGVLVEVLVPAGDADAVLATELAPEAAIGARVPIQRQAGRFVHEALALLEAGRVVCIDYADATSSMSTRPWQEWLRTYRAHERGGHPLEAPGLQDVTCEVAFDQLARVRQPAAARTQAEFLREHGIAALVDEGRRVWDERGHLGDLEALRGRSRVREADALLDPSGLGAFTVMEWVG